jgi:hypothetical protein
MAKAKFGIWRAFDEAAFGQARTLDLHVARPTVAEAVARTEQWLRQQQVARAGEVLVITGRGAHSPDGVSPVRAGVLQHFHSLRRNGVVRSWREHTAGSFIVELAPVGALFEQLPRKKEPRHPVPVDPEALRGVSVETRAALRRLALRSLEMLGVREPERYVEAEMLKQFAALSGALPQAGNRDVALRIAVESALDEMDG